MKYLLLMSVVLIHIICSAQTVSIEKVQAKGDSTSINGEVYKKGDFSIQSEAKLSPGLINLSATVENASSKYVHFTEAEVQVVYNKTTKNSKGIYKTSEKDEKTKIKDVILAPNSKVLFKDQDKLDQRATYKIAYVTGNVKEDKVTELSPSTDTKIKLGKEAVLCNTYLEIEFSFILKEEKSKDVYMPDGSMAKIIVPYLVIKNTAKQDVALKGKLDVAFSFNGSQRHLKFTLPNLKAGESKEEEAKGDVPIVNYMPDVFYIQSLNKPEVTFKTDDK